MSIVKKNSKKCCYHPDNFSPIICLWETKRASNYHLNIPIFPKILVLDLMAVLITCISDEDWIKTEIAIEWTTFSLVYGPSMVGNSYANSRNRANIEFVRDFIPFLVICKFDEDSIKN